jgi:hypothetical protein
MPPLLRASPLADYHTSLHPPPKRIPVGDVLAFYTKARVPHCMTVIMANHIFCYRL